MAERPPRIPRSAKSVFEHIDWQLDFLDASIARYDVGCIHEAQRIATCLRILCYDSPPPRGRSMSLLRQLDFMNHWEFTDTAPVDDGTLGVPWSICARDVPKGHDVRWRAYCAEMDDGRKSSFEEWWGGTILRTEEERYTRAEIILDVANQDGGAHVDPRLESRYHHLSVTAGMRGSTATVEQVVRHPVWELLRQVGYEMQATTSNYNPHVPKPRVRPETGHPTFSLSTVRGSFGPPNPLSDQFDPVSSRAPLV